MINRYAFRKDQGMVVVAGVMELWYAFLRGNVNSMGCGTTRARHGDGVASTIINLGGGPADNTGRRVQAQAGVKCRGDGKVRGDTTGDRWNVVGDGESTAINNILVLIAGD